MSSCFINWNNFFIYSGAFCSPWTSCAERKILHLEINLVMIYYYFKSSTITSRKSMFFCLVVWVDSHLIIMLAYVDEVFTRHTERREIKREVWRRLGMGDWSQFQRQQKTLYFSAFSFSIVKIFSLSFVTRNRRSENCTGILKQALGTRNWVGIGLSYRPARLHRLAELIPWNRF